MSFALVIGAGPAGLMAAEALTSEGHRVVLADQMPSPGRKFLMAGKSGLNLTKAEPLERFLAQYGDAAEWLRPMITAFGPDQARGWAEGLGQEMFTGSTGRVFPRVMKASPLLRAWLARIGGDLRTGWRWQGFDGDAVVFDTPQGPQKLHPQAMVIATGGASWSRLGADGQWVRFLGENAPLAAFAASNIGVHVVWSAHMARHFGAPLKNIALRVAGSRSRGECVISERGLEGGGLYPLIPHLRTGGKLWLDLFPDQTAEALARRLAPPKGKQSLTNHLRKTLKLDGARAAIAQEFARPLPEQPAALAEVLKAIPVQHQGPRPLDEAISTAGGITRDGVDAGLMLKDRPGVFVAGEMLDWDAPTGGYLLTACLATGLWAGRHASHYAATRA